MKYKDIYVSSLIQKIEGICQGMKINIEGFVDADFDDSDIERLEQVTNELDLMRNELSLRAESKSIRMNG